MVNGDGLKNNLWQKQCRNQSTSICEDMENPIFKRSVNSSCHCQYIRSGPVSSVTSRRFRVTLSVSVGPESSSEVELLKDPFFSGISAFHLSCANSTKNCLLRISQIHMQTDKHPPHQRCRPVQMPPAPAHTPV